VEGMLKRCAEVWIGTSRSHGNGSSGKAGSDGALPHKVRRRARESLNDRFSIFEGYRRSVPKI
jgi:hypothetical protein